MCVHFYCPQDSSAIQAFVCNSIHPFIDHTSPVVLSSYFKVLVRLLIQRSAILSFSRFPLVYPRELASLC